MAVVSAQTVQGFQGLPALRQFGLLIGLAASFALGAAVLLWSQQPRYTLLYANLDTKDAGQILDALNKSGIAYKVDEATGAVMVESGILQTARMRLASDDLPQANALGGEMLNKAQGFGSNEFIESARFQRALEGELARTIAALHNVEAARVHLAIPEWPVFLSEHSEPTASVLVDLYAGRTLDDGQIAAIVHLVSSSVPHLTAKNVTVVNQRGDLLSRRDPTDSVIPTAGQFSYQRGLERTYSERIRQLLEPIIGSGKVRATVNASLDFTVSERTQESSTAALPDQSAVRQAAAAVDDGSRGGVHSDEPDKAIGHARLASASIRRLSIAVVVDNKQQLDENDELVSKPWTDAELDRFAQLVKGAVGFNAQRGDTIDIVNASFIPMPQAAVIPEPSLLQQPWVWDVAKQVAGGLGFLIVVFGVLKPVMCSLAAQGAQSVPAAAVPASVSAVAGGAGPATQDHPTLSAEDTQHTPSASPQLSYQQQLDAARGVVSEDPKRVAQVVKNWVGEDG